MGDLQKLGDLQGGVGALFDPMNLTGGGGGGGVGQGGIFGNASQGITGKPSPESQEAAKQAATESTKDLMNMSQGYYNETAPTRNALIGRLTNYLGGSVDPSSNPMYGTAKMGAERTYDANRKQTLSDMATGGGLYESLAGLQGTKADTMSKSLEQLMLDEYNKAYAMGQGSQGVSAAGIQGAANAANNLVSALAQQQQAGAQGTSNVIGLIASLASYLA